MIYTVPCSRRRLLPPSRLFKTVDVVAPQLPMDPETGRSLLSKKSHLRVSRTTGQLVAVGIPAVLHVGEGAGHLTAAGTETAGGGTPADLTVLE